MGRAWNADLEARKPQLRSRATWECSLVSTYLPASCPGLVRRRERHRRFLGLDGRQAVPGDLDRMVETVSHRGPDRRATWVEREVGLGHCMLQTTPESLTEVLPLKIGTLTITADARLDNRAELIGALDVDATQDTPVSDSALILRAYQRWGQDCPQHLLGDFAFAIWDSARRQLFCARDHFGVKPFYYFHQSRKRFAFGTEIKAIFSLGDVSQRLNEAKIADYFLESFEDKARTFYEGIDRLPPACAMVVDRDGLRLRKYWTLEPKSEIRLKSDDEYAEAFRSLFFEAVSCRLRSAFPVGSMLSGGLDSSSITCAAHDLMGPDASGRLHTYSFVFDQISKSDERPYIEKVLSSRAVQSHYIFADTLSPLDDLGRVLWHQDQPFCAYNLSLHRGAWQAANRNGVRVLLDGVFGDNVVSHGSHYLRQLANRWRWITLARETRAVIRRCKWPVSPWQPLRAYFLDYGVRPYVPQAGLKIWQRLGYRASNSLVSRCGAFRSDFGSRVQVPRRLAYADGLERSVRPARRLHAESLCDGSIQTALEIIGGASGEFGIEVRLPFLDKRLVEYCVATPGDQKISQGFQRAILRRAMRGCLPEDIRLRGDKGNLGWSFVSGLNSRRELVEASINSPDGFLERFFSAVQLRRFHDRFATGKMAMDEIGPLFLLVVLSEWGTKGSVN